MYSSLAKYCSKSVLFVLCLDDDTYTYLHTKNYDRLIPLKLSEIEDYEPSLTEIKKNRSQSEYYFTLSPILPLYILDSYTHIQRITTLDADLFFFSSPEPLLNSLQSYSVLITPHRFIEKLKDREIYGLYNVSFQSFKRDKIGIQCLTDWKIDCLNWCFDYLEENKFADQKYLDSWTKRYENVFPIENYGIGSAPWNIETCDISVRNNKIYINNEKLIYFHYQGLRFINKNLIYTGLATYGVEKNSLILLKIYKPYLKFLFSINQNADTGGRAAPIKFSLKQILTERGLIYFIPSFNLIIEPYKFGMLMLFLKRKLRLRFTNGSGI
jgi:hypothetical protein